MAELTLGRALALLAAVVIVLAGAIGTLKYDEYIKPFLPWFICCLPSVILALVIVFIGFAGTASLKGGAKKEETAQGVIKCPKCGSIRLNHRTDGIIECNECGYKW